MGLKNSGTLKSDSKSQGDLYISFQLCALLLQCSCLLAQKMFLYKVIRCTTCAYSTLFTLAVYIDMLHMCLHVDM